MRRHRAVVAIAALVVAAAIGTEAGASTAPPDSTEPATTVHADQPAADAALITLDDFPAGWTETPEEELTGLAIESRRRITECVGGEGDSMLDLGGALAESGTFRGPDGQSVEESVAIVDPSVAEDLMARFTAPDVADCFEAAMQQTLDAMVNNPSDPSESFPADTTLGKATVAPHPAVPATAADEIAGYRITVPLTTQGFDLDLTLDAIAIRAGGSVAGLSFQSVLGPFPLEEIERLVGIAADRLPG
jgi:hypothetical protein